MVGLVKFAVTIGDEDGFCDERWAVDFGVEVFYVLVLVSYD